MVYILTGWCFHKNNNDSFFTKRTIDLTPSLSAAEVSKREQLN